MTIKRKTATDDRPPLPIPATTVEGREEQLILAAMSLVEKRIHEETASPTETVHFLRLGSTKNQLEQEELRQKNAVLEARIKEMESRTSSEGLYADALQAFRGYSGQDAVDPEQIGEYY